MSSPRSSRRKKKRSAGSDRKIPQLPLPPHRRLPTYKRTQQEYSWNANTWMRHEKWADAKARWAQHGIQSSTIENILRRAAIGRMDYEYDLATDLELAKEEIEYRAFIRGLNQRLLRVFTWLEHYHTLPDAQVTESHLRKAVAELSEGLPPLSPHALRKFRFKGRPGEPWLTPIVAQLSGIFRDHGMSANTTTRTIVEALTLAGHGDVVNFALVERLNKEL